MLVGYIVIFYEDLINEPRETLAKLFGQVGVPEKFMDQALEALESDSQGNIFKDKKYKNEKLNYKLVDSVLSLLGLPFTHDIPLKEFRKLFS